MCNFVLSSKSNQPFCSEKA
ncbi:hypothetical protein NGA_0516600 [Nannochloropsis gaditana CCMP526]|nr:hypothetical protein NGA_0516600 [Nannochloropsis gaditana CCMP526]EKU20487.1 hypothetical protein NGA_0516600 [Nannochloropsis gaditana CCMP526]|eukprot:XP_005855878.1 hypothetical protein NGA_0516600 [Nannochloropsis gaditana CCMP526]